jgi:hypothetical protein
MTHRGGKEAYFPLTKKYDTERKRFAIEVDEFSRFREFCFNRIFSDYFFNQLI